MDSRWYSKFSSVLIRALVLVWSWFGEGGFGLIFGLRYLFLGWLFYEIPRSCFEYGTWWLTERGICFNHVYGRVVHGSPKSSQIHLWLIKAKFSYFCTFLYVDFMVDISLIFIWFNAGYSHGYVIGSCHGYFMYLLVIVKWMDARPN